MKKITRLSYFYIVIICIFVLMVLKLGYIQILNGDYYKNIADTKSQKEILTLAPRGEILDRNGLKIATNVQSYNVVYTNSDTKPTDNDLNQKLLEVIKIVEKNNEDKKLNTSLFPIGITGSTFSFVFNTSSADLKKQLEKNFKNKYRIDLSYDAKQTFYYLAEVYKLTNKSFDNNKSNSKSKNKKNVIKPIVIDYTLKPGYDLDSVKKIISLRLAIDDTVFSQYQSIYIANNITKDTAMAIMYKNEDMPQISIEVAPMRYYPNGEVGSAFLGYMGKINENDAEKYTNLGYDINRELVGKTGLEKVLENDPDLNIHLRGEPGYRFVNVDNIGRINKQTATLDPVPGDTAVTTIDLKLQKVAERALDDSMKNIMAGHSVKKSSNANRGAAVVVDVNTGEILALASRPGYDPNWFSENGSISEKIAKLIFPNIKDRYDLVPKRMFNYATMGAGPPGSTFKPLVSIAALQEKVITPSTIIIDKGVYTLVKGFRGACWLWNESHSTHGPVNLAKALEVSCNYFFFDVGRRLGYSNFEQWAWKFGLAANPTTGEKPTTGIEIGEAPGEVSSPENYKTTNINLIMNQEVVTKLSNNKYGGYTITKGTQEYKTIEKMFMTGIYDKNVLNTIGIMNVNAQNHIENQVHIFNSQANNIGQLLNASIGQGTTLLTPIQMASYISTLVNGGNRYKLHLVKKVLNSDGSLKEEIKPELLNKVQLDPNNVAAVKEGMKKVTEEGGTASTAFVGLPIQTGGKTGTASVSPGQARHGRAAYGWYVGFAPLDHPKIAVVVVIYDAGEGAYSAPVARKIYDQYFGFNKPATTQAAVQVHVH